MFVLVKSLSCTQLTHSFSSQAGYDLKAMHTTWVKYLEFKGFCVGAGVPIFAKGSNLIPVDAFESRVTNATLEWLVQSAVASHQNMIRVWYVMWS